MIENFEMDDLKNGLTYETAKLGLVTIGDIVLKYRDADGGGKHYHGRGHFEEYVSPMYRLLANELDPSHCIDIGANYGYTGLLMRRAFPEANLTLVEPIPWLESFVRKNFENNGARFDRFISAIASDSATTTEFGVNTNASQDSRVKAQGNWDVISTTSVTLSEIASPVSADQGVYIKIDTQGWEENVFRGGEQFLSSHNRWFIKTEFAPHWMISQGSDPVEVLESWLEKYDIYESLGRVAWNCSSLADMLGKKLEPGDGADFVDYVQTLNKNGLGWVDLFVLPPASRRAYANTVERPRSIWKRLFG
ncbi:FkbM family methyltransferase [Marivivens aquimaris]|uniref:FkbM family methyltransferase n=1 Tax=Marivivens aquimaris TaxID=2774876 RepID=UPI00187EA4A3|nr:FkbM family methyltransferase [Marivivens aquimaris]